MATVFILPSRSPDVPRVGEKWPFQVSYSRTVSSQTHQTVEDRRPRKPPGSVQSWPLGPEGPVIFAPHRASLERGEWLEGLEQAWTGHTATSGWPTSAPNPPTAHRCGQTCQTSPLCQSQGQCLEPQSCMWPSCRNRRKLQPSWGAGRAWEGL